MTARRSPAASASAGEVEIAADPAAPTSSEAPIAAGPGPGGQVPMPTTEAAQRAPEARQRSATEQVEPGFWEQAGEALGDLVPPFVKILRDQ